MGRDPSHNSSSKYDKSKEYDENYERIFGKRDPQVWKPEPIEEEQDNGQS